MAVLFLAAQRGWDEKVQQLSKSMAYELMLLRYLDDLRAAQDAARRFLEVNGWSLSSIPWNMTSCAAPSR